MAFFYSNCNVGDQEVEMHGKTGKTVSGRPVFLLTFFELL
jgi:hypothetical protein